MVNENNEEKQTTYKLNLKNDSKILEGLWGPAKQIKEIKQKIAKFDKQMDECEKLLPQIQDFLNQHYLTEEEVVALNVKSVLEDGPTFYSKKLEDIGNDIESVEVGTDEELKSEVIELLKEVNLEKEKLEKVNGLSEAILNSLKEPAGLGSGQPGE